MLDMAASVIGYSILLIMVVLLGLGLFMLLIATVAEGLDNLNIRFWKPRRGRVNR